MKHIKQTVLVIKFILLATVVYQIYQMTAAGDFSRLESSIAVIPLIFAGDILKKLGVRTSAIIEIIFLIFLFISSILGSLFHFYEFVDYFDKFAHLLSGIVTAILGIIMLKKWRIKSKHQLSFDIILMNILSLAIASAWEIYEFVASKALNSDLQRVGASGVTDTVHDMIVALIGSLMVSVMYYAIVRNEKYRKLGIKLASLI
ncbi:DUF2238 domain-containing protein [Candidatus Saccharibacteria bacterium]|jgi:uncharacterized membrane protein YjdF|nr:DUF2238 domain-containing protein [Candidatus Saccharibacteria bacterium]NCU43499.1 DUF2238 domain-containing protein [Candidatus Saccharibacteria bacterium]